MISAKWGRLPAWGTLIYEVWSNSFRLTNRETGRSILRVSTSVKQFFRKQMICWRKKVVAKYWCCRTWRKWLSDTGVAWIWWLVIYCKRLTTRRRSTWNSFTITTWPRSERIRHPRRKWDRSTFTTSRTQARLRSISRVPWTRNCATATRSKIKRKKRLSRSLSRPIDLRFYFNLKHLGTNQARRDYLVRGLVLGVRADITEVPLS